MADEKTSLKQRPVASASNKSDEWINVTPDGKVQKKILEQGVGENPPADGTHTMVMHYTGTLSDGTEFDSSVKRGTPFEFVLGANQVIQGWEKGVASMKKGEKAILKIHPDMGYGARGAGGVIPGNAELLFEVSLIDYREGGGSNTRDIVVLAAIIYLIFKVIQFLEIPQMIAESLN